MTTFRFKTEAEANEMSARITWDQAAPLIAAYATRPDALKLELPTGTIMTLKALRFSKANILSLLEKPDTTDLYLMFANSPTDPDNITIIAGGVCDPEGTGGLLDKSLLYDYCEPCPTKCAVNMNG